MSQVRDLRLQRGDLLPQQPDLRIPLRQQLAQPRVRGAQPDFGRDLALVVSVR
jgi:hypothetical protein